MKTAPYENCPLWKFPPLKIPPSENRPQENYHQEINPKKIVPYESYHHSREKLKDITMQWWSWVSWKYRYVFNLTWIVVFL